MYIYAYEYIICKYIKYIYTVEDLRRNVLSKNVFFTFMISLSLSIYMYTLISHHGCSYY